MTTVAGLAAVSPSTVRFWDRIADRYARKPVADEDTYQIKLRMTRTYFRRDMDVLEFGCGTGSTAIAHAPYVRRIEATDLSPRMIAIARRKAAKAGVSNVRFGAVPVEALDAAERRFDAVLGLSVLHLLEDRRAVLAKVHDLLKPGGVFVSSTACIADMMPVFKYIAPVGRALGLFPPLKIFNATQLRADIEAAGFEIEHDWQPGRRKALFLVARKAAK